MACYAGFLAGGEAARLMLAHGRGNIFFTGATAGLRGGVGYAAFASAKFGLRAVAQSAARELGPKNIHVAHLVIERRETARYIKRHGITSFRHNPFFPVNTLTIMRGAVAVQRLGVLERYVDEIFRHMWSEPKKLDDPGVSRAALLESGFDAERFGELVQDADVKAQLLENTERSVERGTFGSPTFFVGDEIFFGKDRLRDVEEMILATR
jgi:2-hydroxychromene-2-carboxylate isomerase